MTRSVMNRRNKEKGCHPAITPTASGLPQRKRRSSDPNKSKSTPQKPSAVFPQGQERASPPHLRKNLLEQLKRHGVRRAQEAGPVLVAHIHEGHEAVSLRAQHPSKNRNVGQHQGMVLVNQGNVIRSAQGAAAQVIKRKPATQ